MKKLTKTLFVLIGITALFVLPRYVVGAPNLQILDKYVYLPMVVRNYPLKVYPLAYVGWEALGTSGDIFTENDDGTNPVNITTHPSHIYAVKWSPNGTKIVFETNWDGNREIYTMNADGSGLLRLTNHSATDQSPSWSPDSSKIVFVSNRSGAYLTYTMNSNGTSVTPLSNLTNCQNPLWSPNGSKIGLSCGTYNEREVYLINPDGSGQVNVTNNAYYDRLLEWSPDSTKLMVLSNRGTGGTDDMNDTYVLNTNGTTYLTLTTDGNGMLGSWSPDGTRIIYSDAAIGSTGMWLVSANGTGKAELKCETSMIWTTELSWSPDSTRIAYSPEGTFLIYVAHVDGSACEAINDFSSTMPQYYPVK